MIAASSDLRLRYERERRVVELLRNARETDRGPVRLRARLEAHRPSRRVVALDPAGKLAQRVGDAYFPNWAKRLGWRASGQRTDGLDHRRAVTVYYRRRDDWIAYTIVGAPALAQPAARAVKLGGVELLMLTVHGRVVVTWHRGRQTCVLSGGRVKARQLERLAAWKPSA